MRLVVVVALAVLAGCVGYLVRPNSGGGNVRGVEGRVVDARDVRVPPGYQIEVVAKELDFPTAVVFDDEGTPHVVESGYSYDEYFGMATLKRVNPDGTTTVLAQSDNPPWNGAVFHDGHFYVAEGGQTKGGRILKVARDGSTTVLVAGLPSLGDHHTNGPVIGGDGYLYFAQGTATNSGVVGEDNFYHGWLKRFPDFHDVPCRDITLTGTNFDSQNHLTEARHDMTVTGAFVPFGTPTTPGQVIKGKLPCSGAVLRVPLTGGELELVAWGLRNPYGLAFHPDGRLFATENGYDIRGSRSVYGAEDHLYEIKPGLWYGWPDFVGDRPVADARYRIPGHSLTVLMAEHPNPPPRPNALFGCNSSANRFDFSRSEDFGHPGEAFVALFGDMTPSTGKVLAPVGFKVVRVNADTGVVEDFAINAGKHNGPASYLKTGGLERPMDARFDPSGRALYVADFGVMTVHGKLDPLSPIAIKSHPKTGVLWRITRKGGGTS